MNRHAASDDPGSGSYAAARRALNRWLYGIAGTVVVGVVLMVLKHESDLAVIKASQVEIHDDIRDIKRVLMPTLTSNHG